jgi:hypothetical protein
VGELTSLSGSYFDPEVVEAFEKYFAEVMEPRSRRLSERTLNEPGRRSAIEGQGAEEQCAEEQANNAFRERELVT